MRDDWIKIVNEKLMDAESKKVFASRVLYSITGDNRHLYNLGDEFKQSVRESCEWKRFLDELKIRSDRGPLFLYGAGAFGEKMLDMTDEIIWNGVIDKLPKQDSIRGVNIQAIDRFIDERNGNETIVIPSIRYYEEMKSFLLEEGIDEKSIVDGTILYNLTEGKQYFDLYELSHIDDKEIFLDIGCCDGMSSVQFLKWCNGKGFCYCFEPDEKNIEMVKANLRAKGVPENNYMLIPKGAWDEEGRLSFVASGNGASHVAGVYGAGEFVDTESIDVTTIDNAVGDVPVTFIKMDIEGAELNALRGASGLIRNRKPKLAICVYHKAEDILEIPTFILKLRPDYKLFLRHYSFEQSETVLYAI